MFSFNLPTPNDLADGEPRCPCVLLLDTSGSMGGAPIAQLNQGLAAFQGDLNQDDVARHRVEVAIVTFGKGGVQVAQDFTTVQNFQPPVLEADEETPMGQAINTALDLLRSRKSMYQQAAIPYYRPWVFLITDGKPTDAWQGAAQRIRAEEANKSVTFFAVGVTTADLATLAQIAPPTRPPVKLDGLKFKDMFLWLSRSLGSVSHSQPGQSVPLPPPTGWTEVQI